MQGIICLISLMCHKKKKQQDEASENSDNDSENKKGTNYLIAGIILNCGSGLSVAPNVRMTSYEESANRNRVTNHIRR